ncbi:hypothetical protein CC78DRAFT_566250 [Lojkania enalia]|uniref:Rhodopsin domain-containing protein n=1 Tax=Lojkania enalia TaxID=147567 RepID=A0A9P4KEN7_9PLEO|nr:hypothetical protein CC78DRAFT_566250 [Didymosphaeria enalia]
MDFARVETSKPLLSLTAFQAVLWTGFSICFFACAVRLYIRWKCFHRFLVDDYVMMFALALQLSVAVLGETFLDDVYLIVEFENGERAPDKNFSNIMKRGLRGFGAALTISLVGITAVKLNFLLFFRRLGTQITSYYVIWWIILIFTLGCGGVNLGLMDYKCVFARDLVYVITKCAQRSAIKRYFDFQKTSVILDVVSDALIIYFPVAILWRVKIGLRKKIILSGTFGLVAFTIAVTIVRGSVFGGAYKSFDENKRQNLNMSWMWFWMFIEFSVAFLIACIVSFRALFAQREQRAYEKKMAQRQIAWQNSSTKRGTPRGLFERARYIHNSLLETFKTLETVDMELPAPESGRFSATFLTEIETAHLPKERATSSNDSGTRHSFEFNSNIPKLGT